MLCCFHTLWSCSFWVAGPVLLHKCGAHCIRICVKSSTELLVAPCAARQSGVESQTNAYMDVWKRLWFLKLFRKCRIDCVWIYVRSSTELLVTTLAKHRLGVELLTNTCRGVFGKGSCHGCGYAVTRNQRLSVPFGDISLVYARVVRANLGK